MRAWAAAYLGAYRTHWRKTLLGFTVNGAWAFERYTYVATDTGKGINVFHRGADGG